MIEKRFELEISSFSGKHMKFLNILDNGKRLNSEEIVDLLNEQQDAIRKLRNENIISKNKIEDLRASLFMLNKELERQIQKRGLDE